jgi:hypothetical protein
MVSQIKVNEIIKQSGSSISIGESGDTITLPSSATLTNFPDNTPYFVASKTSSQTLTHTATTKVTFDSVPIESSSGVFDLSNDKFTVVTAGKYNFQINVTFFDSNNALKRMDGLLYKNGSQHKKFIFYDNGGNIREVPSHYTFFESVSVDDYFELYSRIETTDSGTADVVGGGDGQTFFSGYKLIGI